MRNSSSAHSPKREASIFNLLLELPLFQGLSSVDLNEIVAHAHFDFTKTSEQTTLIREGESCSDIVFLLHGTVMAERGASNGNYRVREFLHAPAVIGPEHLFGLSPYHDTSYTTQTPCSLFTLSKNEVLKISRQFLVFHLNLLNLLSTRLWRQQRQLWHQSPASVRELIVRFFQSHCQYPAGEKTFIMRMEDPAREIHDSRLDVSRELNAMQEEGLVSLSRRHIHIPSLQKLTMK